MSTEVENFSVKLVDVSVKGVDQNQISDKALVYNGSEIIRFVKKSFVLVEPNIFVKSVKSFINDVYPNLEFVEVRNYGKVFSQAVHFKIPNALEKLSFVSHVSLVIFNSYMSDYNLGVGLNIHLTDGSEFFLNDYEGYPTIRKFETNFHETLIKLEPTIVDYLTTKIKLTEKFFTSNRNSYDSLEVFVHDMFGEKTSTAKHQSLLSNINGCVGISEFCFKVNGDRALILGLLIYNYERSKEFGIDYYFYNRYYKAATKKITNFIWS